MASESDFIIQIGQALAQYDDDSLATIANKGMVRRARKDLQNGDVKGIIGDRLDSSDRTWARLQVAAYVVEISALGAAKATCTCPAVEVCRHILAASIWLSEKAALGNSGTGSVTTNESVGNSDHLTIEDQSSSIATANDQLEAKGNDRPNLLPASVQSQPLEARQDLQQDSRQNPKLDPQPLPRSSSSESQTNNAQPCQELLEYSATQLKKWAGKKNYEAAIVLLTNHPAVEIIEGSPVIIKLPDFKVECRYFWGAGLEGMVCTRKSPQTNRYLTLAILAYQKQHGISPQAIALPENAIGSDDPANEQIELLQQMIQLFSETLGMGVCNLSNAVQQRFTSLSVSATGANLPRLAKVLRGIANEIDLLARRSAQADERRLFLELARADAIANATLQILTVRQVPPVSLVGQHRSKYEEIGNLDLTGVGAYHWESKTGYAGVTVLFWENEAKQWFCWSEVRPTFRGMGFSPWWRYKQSDLWEQNPETLSQNSFKLFSARRNHQNRLSASSQSKVMMLSKSEPVKLDFGDRYFKCWRELRNYAAKVVRTGLGEYNLLQEMVVVSPEAWGDRDYDQVNQIFNWWLDDEDGDSLPLRIWYRPTDEGRIKFLETLHPSKYWVWGIVAQLSIASDGLSLYPISLLCQPPIEEAVKQQDSQTQPEGQSKASPENSESPGISERPGSEKKNKNSKKEVEYRTIINLSFVNKKYTKFSESNDSSDRHEAQDLTDANGLDAIEDLDLAITPLDLRVDWLVENLQRLAEHGGFMGTEMEQELKLVAKEFDRVGLSLFANLLNRLSSLRGSDREFPKLLLKLRYLCRLWQENRLKINLLN
jgi:hypothetical protein